MSFGAGQGAPEGEAMPNPAEETFRGNKITISVVTVVAGGFAVLAYLAMRDPGSRDLASALFWLAILALFAVGLAHLVSLRVSIHPYGVSKQTCFASKEMRWDEVERLYYVATKRSVNLIPIGTYYSFRLVDRHGGRMAFSNAVERPSRLGQRLVEGTFEPLLRKAVQVFDSGAEQQFGPIKLSRDRGLKITGLFGNKEIPLSEVSQYRIEKGHFYIFKAGQKRTTGPAISRIPNVFVLRGLLDAIYRGGAQRNGAPQA